jgi:hypothetical protein
VFVIDTMSHTLTLVMTAIFLRVYKKRIRVSLAGIARGWNTD